MAIRPQSRTIRPRESQGTIVTAMAGLAYPASRLDTARVVMKQIRFGALLALLLCQIVPARAACQVVPLTTVPIDLIDGHLLVAVSVNDIAATFILDTGAERTLMGE